jgi:hypothetical protein
MNATTRPILAAVIAAALTLPASAAAGDGGARPMTASESYALTCGHLGVPCDPPQRRHSHRARRAHAGRHHHHHHHHRD